MSLILPLCKQYSLFMCIIVTGVEPVLAAAVAACVIVNNTSVLWSEHCVYGFNLHLVHDCVYFIISAFCVATVVPLVLLLGLDTPGLLSTFASGTLPFGPTFSSFWPVCRTPWFSRFISCGFAALIRYFSAGAGSGAVPPIIYTCRTTC